MVVLEDAPPPRRAPCAGGTVNRPGGSLPDGEAFGFDIHTAFVRSTACSAPPSSEGSVRHVGGCHCGAIRFEVYAPASLTAWDCNCSDCLMRRNTHFVVPKASLRLIQDARGGHGGAANLAEYRWGSGVARHLFCATCGISPFYAPRSNPDGWAVTVHCLDGGSVAAIDVRRFDGKHWEDFIAGEGGAIKAFSRGGGATAADVDAAAPPPRAWKSASAWRRAPWYAALFGLCEPAVNFVTAAYISASAGHFASTLFAAAFAPPMAPEAEAVALTLCRMYASVLICFGLCQAMLWEEWLAQPRLERMVRWNQAMLLPDLHHLAFAYGSYLAGPFGRRDASMLIHYAIQGSLTLARLWFLFSTAPALADASRLRGYWKARSATRADGAPRCDGSLAL